MSKKFHISVILTITTGIFVCEDFSSVYDILNYMTDDDLYTHALPRASRECLSYLLDQCPDLKNIAEPKFDINKDKKEIRKDINNWIKTLLSKGYKEFYDINPIPKDDHDILDPVEELKKMMKPGQQLIVFKIDNNESDDISTYGNLSPKEKR